MACKVACAAAGIFIQNSGHWQVADAGEFGGTTQAIITQGFGERCPLYVALRLIFVVAATFFLFPAATLGVGCLWVINAILKWGAVPVGLTATYVFPAAGAPAGAALTPILVQMSGHHVGQAGGPQRRGACEGHENRCRSADTGKIAA